MRTTATIERVAGLLCLFAAIAHAGATHAAELRVVAGSALSAPLTELAAKFTAASGHQLTFRYGTTPELIALAKSAEPFDLGVFPREVLADAAARAQFVADPPQDIAHAGLGLAVRAGAARPDIRTADALRRTLLAARCISTLPGSATGAQLLQVFAAMGIADALQPKIRAAGTATQVVEAVTQGGCEMAVFLTHVLRSPGLDLVGPFPAAVQREVVFTAIIAQRARARDAAAAFAAYLTSPEAIAILRARGMQPGGKP